MIKRCILNRLHFAGGLGDSGMGSCLGKASFDAFSHRRSIVHKYFNYNNNVCDNDARYPPCTPAKVNTFSSLLFSSLPASQILHQGTANAPLTFLCMHKFPTFDPLPPPLSLILLSWHCSRLANTCQMSMSAHLEPSGESQIFPPKSSTLDPPHRV